MPSLEQLYGKSPLEQYGNLSLGVLMSMQPGEAGEYQTRQQEYNQQIDELNRRAMEINPHIVEQQRLANQQQQYMMPTYEAQGMKAQAEMKTPGFFQAGVDSKMAEFGKTGAEANLAAATARGALPTAQETAATQSQMTLDASKNAAFYQLLTSPQIANAPPEEVKAWFSKRMPNQAANLNALVDKMGVQGAASAIAKQMEQMALVDPKHLQKLDELAHTPQTPRATNEWDILLAASKGDPDATKAWNMHVAQNPSASKAAVIQLAEGYARAAGRKTPNAEDYDKANRVVQVVENIVKTETMARNPTTGEIEYRTETTKGQGTQGGGAQPRPGPLPKGTPLKLPPGATLK